MNEGKKVTHRKKRRRVKRAVKLTLQLFLFLFLLSTLIGILYFYFAYGKTILSMQADAREKVSTSTYDTFKASQTSLVYDSEGNVISTLKAEKDVFYLDYEDIPQLAVDAVIVSEDRKFYEHKGVDYIANVRAAIALIEHGGKITQGASTITQQLARKIFLTDRVSYERKIEEIFIAQELEKKYSKTDILEFYLNNIYYANGHYGIQAASKSYLGKSAGDLTLSQIAFLSAVPNNPNLYNPVTNFDNTMKRRDRILKQLYDDKKITEEEYQQALDEKITLKDQSKDKKNYVETYIYHSAIEALMKREGFQFRNQFESDEDKKSYDEAYNSLYESCQQDLFVSGYRIYTSIDMKKQTLLQKSVDNALKNFTEKGDDGVYKLQAAAVSIDNDTGRVVAIVGGRSQNLEGYTFNRGYQSYRQPGSSIKPLIVYTPSFERNYTPDSIVVDEPIKGGPSNSDNTYSGKIKLQRAVELSKNTIAWKLYSELTPRVGLSYLYNMNFKKISDKDDNLASGLGGLTVGVSPVEMASAYATLENDGVYREPTCIVKIMDSDGKEIVGDNTDSKAVYESKAAKIMTEVLTGVIKNGTGKGLGLTNTVSAGKTGTTNNKKDGWFVGYTPYYTTSVWVGYDLPKTLSDLAGSTYPGTIWHDYMEKIHDANMTKSFDFYDWRAETKTKEEPTVTPEGEKVVLPADPAVGSEDNSSDNQPADNTDTGTENGNASEDTGNSPVVDEPAGTDTGESPSQGDPAIDSGDNSVGEDPRAGTGTDQQGDPSDGQSSDPTTNDPASDTQNNNLDTGVTDGMN